MDRVAALPEVRAAQRVAAYVALPDEVNPSGLWPRLATRSTTLLLPRITAGAERLLEFAEWDGRAPLEANDLGIGEPHGPAVPLADIDVVILPCVAVDDLGTRVGFGAGYYDRTLAGPDEGRPSLVGVAFEVQRVDRIAANPWDVPLDIVVTEAGVSHPGLHEHPERP